MTRVCKVCKLMDALLLVCKNCRSSILPYPGWPYKRIIHVELSYLCFETGLVEATIVVGAVGGSEAISFLARYNAKRR
eukprot:c13033_g1_i2 orf=190-423(+)